MNVNFNMSSWMEKRAINSMIRNLLILEVDGQLLNFTRWLYNTMQILDYNHYVLKMKVSTDMRKHLTKIFFLYSKRQIEALLCLFQYFRLRASSTGTFMMQFMIQFMKVLHVYWPVSTTALPSFLFSSQYRNYSDRILGHAITCTLQMQ